jgi:asparagine synthase (glutamine-hydrolysing)
MCGFAGFFGGKLATNRELADTTLEAMAEEIITRGPDSSGLWCMANDAVGMSHRRLSILDLSPAGHQPMLSQSRRYTIAFNGEIYNHLELREKLGKDFGPMIWKGSSDTETLLACIDNWGVHKTLSNLVGMFAFSLWDNVSKILTLSRDRVGEKPLYYGWQGSGIDKVFLFGSDLKSFKAYPNFNPVVDRNALCLFLRHNYVPAPHCIYEGFNKLEPGCYLSISKNQMTPKIIRYWNAESLLLAGVNNPSNLNFTDLSSYVETKIVKAVNRQSLSDVPLGTFLSGGIDSSVITALLQSQSIKPVKTFTIGFEEASYNEAIYAKKIAKHLGTNHTELYVSSKDALDLIPDLPNIYGEPFADSSQIPTILLSILAKKDVTVVLSGDGGDELFCGYNRYNFADNLWHKLAFLPSSGKHALANLLMAVPSRVWDMGETLSLAGKASSRLSEKVQKVAGVLSANSVHDLYNDLISDFNNPSEWVIGGTDASNLALNEAYKELGTKRFMMLKDLLGYLPNDILTKVDRASMAVSLETRVPFLDHELVEATFNVPIDMHLYRGKSKSILRDILYKYVPQDLIERPKMGFGIPLDSWLRGPLKEWAESQLDERRLDYEGYFVTQNVRKMWMEHLNSSKNWSSQLWNILMFQSWLENQKL